LVVSLTLKQFLSSYCSIRLFPYHRPTLPMHWVEIMRWLMKWLILEQYQSSLKCLRLS
jgi:hypothetical protein